MPRRPDAYNRRRLVSRLAEVFREVGFSWRSAREIRPRPLWWARPPLFTRARLGDEPMQLYLSVRSPLRIDELAGAYEAFIGGFLYSRKFAEAVEPDKWLRRELGLPYWVCQQLFCADAYAGRQALHMHLVQFAALVAYNHPAHYEHGPDTFVVIGEASGLQFGVRSGRLVTNFERPSAGQSGLRNPYGNLVQAPQSRPVKLASPTFYDTLAIWLAMNAERLGPLAGALQLGVALLRWRHPPRLVPGELRLLAAYEFSKEALAQACSEARQYAKEDDPINFLKEIFTPQFLKPNEFAEIFGNPHRRVTTPVPYEIRQKWDLAIDSLDPGFEGDELGKQQEQAASEQKSREAEAAT